MNKSNAILLIVAAIAAMAAGLWFGQEGDLFEQQATDTPAMIQGAIYPRAKILSDINLTNQLSEKVTRDNFKNHWSLVFVGYTHCPDVCPTTLTLLNQVADYMQQQKIKPPEIVFLSIDPQRDTPEIMKTYIEYFNPEFTGLTGSLDEVTNFSRQLNAVFRKAPGLNGKITDDDYLMDHSSALMLINPQGNLQAILTAPHTPGKIIESIIQSQVYYDSIKDE